MVNLCHLLLYIFNANNSVIIIEKTSFHSCFHKAAPIDVEKPLINAQFIMHNFVAKAALKILEAAFIMPVLIVRVLTACD